MTKGAPVVHEFQIRESDPWYGEFVATEGETWFVFAHEFKAYREWVIKIGGDLQAKLADVQASVSGLEQERDTWKRIAEQAGACMTCALGAPDISIGCTDCLNTGFEHGAPRGYVSEAFHEEKIAKLETELAISRGANRALEEWTKGYRIHGRGSRQDDVVGVPMLAKTGRNWEVLGEDGARFSLVLVSPAPSP